MQRRPDVIAWLSGTVVSRDPAQGTVVLDVQGVGYELRVSLQTLTRIADVGQDYQALVHTHVREDQLTLYGFDDEAERTMFRLLTTVPKVGPKHALAVLGGFPLDEVVACISSRDPGKLQKIPGIGKKTSEQIVLSLADKLDTLHELFTLPPDHAPAPASVDEELGSVGNEAQLTLAAWGWKPKPAAQAVARVLQESEDEGLPLEELLRRAMRRLTER
ncbi:MAG: Holliday junction branch migration protein RuvA [Myxococcales bacterium FL481]|nr:MAG: Holliday junction branch migration protein RuvA [Myxococcales bacterium FL481]